MTKSEFEHYNLKRPLFNKDVRKRFKRRAKLIDCNERKCRNLQNINLR